MKKAAFWAAAGVAAALITSVVVLALFDWNRAKPWFSARVSSAIERPFSIRGDLSIDWKKSLQAESGWRGWIPWPQLTAHDVRVGNPVGFPTPGDLAAVGQVTFSLNPLPLLRKTIVVSMLRLDNPQLLLERKLDGANNWTFGTTDPLAWQLELKSVVLAKGSLRLIDAQRHADVTFNVDTLAQGSVDGYDIGWKVSGSFNKEAVSGTGRAGGVLSLQTQASPFPIEADVHVGKTAIKVKGTLTRPRDLAALDMRLRLSGASMAHLFPLTGVLLPETPAYATDGHLTATLNKFGGDWVYDKFNGKVGSSDISGTMEYLSRRPRGLLKGEVVSNLLNFSDLAPVIGADSNRSKVNRGGAAVQPAGKVLPVEPFKTERWRSVDADVKFTGRRIVRDKALPIDNLVMRLHLQDGVLVMAPLDFGVAGGTLSSKVTLDARGNAIKADMKTTARHLNLKQLFPTIRTTQTALGAINGDATLSATGNSVALMLGSSNGEVKATISKGTISKLLLDEIGLNIGSVVLAKLFGDKDINLRCATGDFSVKGGVMQARSVVVDTDQSTLNVEGKIDLAREQLDLTLKPVSKRLRIISLTSPLYVTGSFASPSVSIDKGTLALKVASAVALAVLTPAAALIPLTSMGRDEDGDCRKPHSALR